MPSHPPVGIGLTELPNLVHPAQTLMASTKRLAKKITVKEVGNFQMITYLTHAYHDMNKITHLNQHR